MSRSKILPLLICFVVFTISSFSVGTASEQSKCEKILGFAPVMDGLSSGESQDAKSILTGCDTRTQINTSAKLNVLVNNPNYTFSFIGRYLQNGNDDEPKKITPKELELLTGASISIVSLYQKNGTSPSNFSNQKGISHATDAVSCAAAIDQPSGKPIYFCVDFWPGDPSEMQRVLNYFSGVSSIMNNNSSNPRGYKIGVYGCSTVLKKLRQIYPQIYTMLAGTENCFDGTYFTNWNIHQSPEVTIQYNGTSLTVDIDQGVSISCGKWNHSHSYPGSWTNYGNSARHRHKCYYCTAYQYQLHTPNSTNTRCTVCGYEGVISSPTSIITHQQFKHFLYAAQTGGK